MWIQEFYRRRDKVSNTQGQAPEPIERQWWLQGKKKKTDWQPKPASSLVTAVHLSGTWPWAAFGGGNKNKNNHNKHMSKQKPIVDEPLSQKIFFNFQLWLVERFSESSDLTEYNENNAKSTASSATQKPKSV